MLSLCPPTGFQWSGCSDNLSYGVAFSQTFVDEPERAKGLSAGRPLMNLHNNEAGRKVGGCNISLYSPLCHLFDFMISTYLPHPLILRPSFTTCRWSVSVMVSLAPASYGPAGRLCLHSGALVWCSKNALMEPRRYQNMLLLAQLVTHEEFT